MNYRRSVLKKISKIGLAAIPIGLFYQARAKASDTGMFLHHVFFWLKNPDDPEERKIFESALKELGSIESIHFLHIGKPADTNRPVIDNSYHYSFLVGFKDKTGHDVYQEHPIHDKFRNEYSSMWTRVLVYDSVNL
jgi:hypothetical protein